MTSEIGWTADDSVLRKARVAAQNQNPSDYRPLAEQLLMHLECLVMAIDPDDCGIDTSQAERIIMAASKILRV